MSFEPEFVGDVENVKFQSFMEYEKDSQFVCSSVRNLSRLPAMFQSFMECNKDSQFVGSWVRP